MPRFRQFGKALSERIHVGYYLKPFVVLELRLRQAFFFALILAWTLRCSHTATAREFDFIVAPSGDDAWSGTLASPNHSKTDGPFATLDHAREAVRVFKQAQPERIDPIIVLLRGGTYFL